MGKAQFEKLARETEASARMAKTPGERAALLQIARSYRALAAHMADPFRLVGEREQRSTFAPAETTPMRHTVDRGRRRAAAVLRSRSHRPSA